MVTETVPYLDTAEAAKLIKRRLATVFPGQRFSVRTSRYAGGSSIDVSWTDGPRTKLVERETAPFEGKGFDGMIDMAYSKDTWILPDGSAQRAAIHGTEASRGSTPSYVTDAPHPNAKLVRASCFVFCRRELSDAPNQITAAGAYIRQHCKIDYSPDGNPMGDRFGNDWVHNLASNMAMDRSEGEGWDQPFARVVLRE